MACSAYDLACTWPRAGCTACSMCEDTILGLDQDQDQVFLLVATNLRAQAEFNPRAFHGVVAAPDASVYRRRKSPATGLPLPQQRGGRE